MQQAIEQFLMEQGVTATCHITEDGQSIHVNYELADGTWASNHITLKNRRMHVSAWNSLGSSVVDIMERFHKGVAKEMEDVFLVMLKSWGFVLKQLQPIDVLTLSIDADRFGKKVHEVLKEKGLKQLDGAQKKFIEGHFDQEATWLMQFQENEIVKGIHLATHLNLFLQKKKEEDLTMVINWEMEKALLHLYYRGHHESFQTAIQNGTLRLESEETHVTIQDEASAQTALKDWFVSIEEKALETIIYYDEFVKEAAVRTSMSTYLLEELRVHYSVFDIETYAAKWLRAIHETKRTILYNEEMKLFAFLNHIVFIDYDADQVTLFEQKEQAIALFQERALKKKQQELQEEINGFMQGMLSL